MRDIIELLSEATCLPWSHEREDKAEMNYVISEYGIVAKPPEGDPDAETVANSALIVHCVNNFMPLLEALEMFVKDGEYRTQEGPHDTPGFAMRQAKAALALAAAKEVK